MRIPVVAGSVALCAGIVIGTQIFTAPVKASAQSEVVTILKKVPESTEEKNPKTPVDDDNVVKEAVDSIIESSEIKETREKEEKETIHTVKKGESLEKIAKTYEIEDWTRIYDKNEDIEDPNLLEVNQKLVIPDKDEELEERELPEETFEEAAEETVMSQSSDGSRQQTASQSVQQTHGSTTKRQVNTAGNGYSYGYCTWYVKNLRPDLPNNLGNANTWYSRAAAQGYSVGYSPRVGAVAEALRGYMHVAYVSAVHGDGTITVQEMNFKGWNVASTRRVAAAEFRYIY